MNAAPEAPPAASGVPGLSPTASRWALFALWALTATILLAMNWSLIQTMSFRDPDDALRLVEVRDLLAGQSWFDLTQYRLLPPHGVLMHWSRLVDLPLAGAMLLLRPLLGPALAELVTLACMPLLYLLALFVTVEALSRRLGLSRLTALLSAALLATSMGTLVQFVPMRIDHHGAQVLYGGLALLALVSVTRIDGRMGLFAGAAFAAWLQISIEGLPYALLVGGLYGLRYLWRADRWRDMAGYLIGLTGVSALLLFGTRAPADALHFWCDSMSPSYLLPLAATTGTLLAAGLVAPRHSPLHRLVPLALAGIAGAATYLLASRQCLAGPFATLDPLVRQYWYYSVLEGLPITAQKADLRAIILLPALLGLIGSSIALRRAVGVEKRLAWASLLVMQVASFALALDVMRAMSFAHFAALPGNAVLLATLIRAAQRLTSPPLRVMLTTATAVLTPFGTAAAMAAAMTGNEASAAKARATPDRSQCTAPAHLRGLEAMPATTLFTPLDIGAHLLAYTHHRVVATGHHRNIEGMKAVVHAFLADPDQARAIVTATGATHLAFCAGENEVVRYARARPHSLDAMLIAGHHPDWLEPVPMPAGETIQIFKIRT